MWQKIVTMILVFPIVALADVCPKDGEKVQTTPYTKMFQCSTSSIVIKGETNPEKYQECLGEVPAAKEAAYFQIKGQPPRLLPSVNSLALKDDLLIQTKVWMESEVHCQDANTITVDYWGGGNCLRCALSVQYIFNKDGSLKEAHLK